MDSRKTSIYIAIVCMISISLVSVYFAYFTKPDILHADSKKTTRLSSEVSPQIIMGSLDDLSLKGYLTTSDNAGILNGNVKIILEQIRMVNNQTIEKNLVIGNSTTDQNGCFYFNSWNNDQVEKLLREISPSSDANNFLSFKTIFTGTDEFSSSSNTTEVRYSPVVAPVIRVPINVILANNTDLIQDIDLKRGKSYDFDLLVSKGGMLFSQEEKILKLDIKSLPCGVNGVIENNIANLTAHDQVKTHLRISVDEKTKAGEYYYFIIGNNWTLREAKLIIE